eukprot:1031784-Prorocentrum_minimum.AAC.1
MKPLGPGSKGHNFPGRGGSGGGGGGSASAGGGGSSGGSSGMGVGMALLVTVMVLVTFGAGLYVAWTRFGLDELVPEATKEQVEETFSTHPLPKDSPYFAYVSFTLAPLVVTLTREVCSWKPQAREAWEFVKGFVETHVETLGSLRYARMRQNFEPLAPGAGDEMSDPAAPGSWA